MDDDDSGYGSGEEICDDDEDLDFWDSFYEELIDAAALPNCSSNGPD